MTTTRLSTKSQIVIPISIRKRLDLKPGDTVEIDAEGERIIIRKVRPLKNVHFCSSSRKAKVLTAGIH
jgi:AbrB family looped-hinge helix DNA binding protein